MPARRRSSPASGPGRAPAGAGAGGRPAVISVPPRAPETTSPVSPPDGGPSSAGCATSWCPVQDGDSAPASARPTVDRQRIFAEAGPMPSASTDRGRMDSGASILHQPVGRLPITARTPRATDSGLFTVLHEWATPCTSRLDPETSQHRWAKRPLPARVQSGCGNRRPQPPVLATLLPPRAVFTKRCTTSGSMLVACSIRRPIHRYRRGHPQPSFGPRDRAGAASGDSPATSPALGEPIGCPGIVPANDREGCLQDGHWAEGSLGCPTYALGNVYAAQPPRPEPSWATRYPVRPEDFRGPRLRVRVHRHGQRYRRRSGAAATGTPRLAGVIESLRVRYVAGD
jgi:hypothetical protein